MAELVNAGDPYGPDFPTGPAIGERIPDFELPDQFGNPVRYSIVRGGNQALILFHRSASW
jgi:peroxiredoxin